MTIRTVRLFNPLPFQLVTRKQACIFSYPPKNYRFARKNQNFGAYQSSDQNKESEKAWSEPIVGFSKGADPIFEAYKEYVGPFHYTPLELFSKRFPSLNIQADQRSLNI